jgi:mRNA interferase MazF
MSAAPTLTRRSIRRADIHWVDFGQPPGRELCGIHPAIVISPDGHNANPSSSLVRVIPLTTLRRSARHDEVVIVPPEGGVRHASLARIIQARPVDRTSVFGRLGRVSAETMENIETLILDTNGIGAQ